MGCHTWHSVPYLVGKEEILKKAKLKIEEYYPDKSKKYDREHRAMHEYAIANELETCIADIFGNRIEDWKLYEDVKYVSLMKYNEEHGTNYDSIYDVSQEIRETFESYSDEPRIGGYPDTVIHSYDEMVEFMKTGFTDDQGRKYDFYYDEDRKDQFMGGIKEFFTKHPDGIITFG